MTASPPSVAGSAAAGAATVASPTAGSSVSASPTSPGPTGPLALIGGAEWTEGCTYDADLWEASGWGEVLVLPTAAAYEHPQRAVETARSWFGRIGAEVRGLPVLARPDAEDDDNAATVRAARFVYLGGGSPLHLRSVLKDSKVWAALVAAWRDGAVLAGSSAGAMILGDPMVDPRGGALTLGLGLVPGFAVLPHSDLLSPEKAHRTVSLATGDLRIATVDERTALIRDPDGTWHVAGAGSAAVWFEGTRRGVDVLAGVDVAAGPAGPDAG